MVVGDGGWGWKTMALMQLMVQIQMVEVEKIPEIDKQHPNSDLMIGKQQENVVKRSRIKSLEYYITYM